MGRRAYRQVLSGQIMRSLRGGSGRCDAGWIDRPLIVTAVLDASSTARFDELRRRYFPPDRLVVGAHVTLFHHLPGDHEPAIRAVLAAEARRLRPLTATVAGPRSLGRGVAYDLECPDLVAARARLAEGWSDHLTGQDRAWRRPHVTVQNKVSADVARVTLDELRARPPLPPARVEGFGLWRYLGGPWEPLTVVLLGVLPREASVATSHDRADHHSPPPAGGAGPLPGGDDDVRRNDQHRP